MHIQTNFVPPSRPVPTRVASGIVRRGPLAAQTTYAQATAPRFAPGVCARHVDLPATLFTPVRLPWYQRAVDGVLQTLRLRASGFYATRRAQRDAALWADAHRGLAAAKLLRTAPAILWQGLCESAQDGGAVQTTAHARAVLIGLMSGCGWEQYLTPAHSESAEQLRAYVTGVAATPTPSRALFVTRAATLLVASMGSDEALLGVWGDVVNRSRYIAGPTTFDEEYLRRVATRAASLLPREQGVRIWRTLDRALGYLLPAKVSIATRSQRALTEAIEKSLFDVLAAADGADEQLLKDLPRAQYVICEQGSRRVLPKDVRATAALRAFVGGDMAWYQRVARLTNQTLLNAMNEASFTTPGASFVAVEGEPCLIVGAGGATDNTLRFTLRRLNRDVVRIEATHDRALAYLEPVAAGINAPQGGWVCEPSSRMQVRLFVDVRRPSAAGARLAVGGLSASGEALRDPS